MSGEGKACTWSEDRRQEGQEVVAQVTQVKVDWTVCRAYPRSQSIWG